MVWSLEALRHQDDGVFRELHFQDRGGIQLQQQFDAIQLQLQGTVSDQNYHRGHCLSGGPCGLFQAEWLLGLVEVVAPGRPGSLWLWCPAGREVGFQSCLRMQGAARTVALVLAEQLQSLDLES